MATKINAGAPIPNPGTGVKAPRKKKVAPVGAASTGAAAGAAGASAAVLAMHAALLGLKQFRAAIQAYMRTFVSKGKGRGNHVSVANEGQIPNMARILRMHPDLAAGIDPAVMEDHVALVALLRELAVGLGATQAEVNASARAYLAEDWQWTREVYSAGHVRAKRDPALAAEMAPFEQARQKGPRVDANRRGVAASQVRLTAAQRRAASAQHAADLAKLNETSNATLSAARAHAPAPAAAPVPPPPTGPITPR